MPKAVLTGGGTMGHVIPNLVIAKGLTAGGYDVVYIGSSSTREKKAVVDAGIQFYNIPAGKLRRYLSYKNILDIFNIISGFFHSFLILIKERPDVLFGKGGYVAVPVVTAAYFLRIPVIIHESDLTMGLANKLCMPFAKVVCYSFPESGQYIDSKKAVHTGLPVRNDLLKGDPARGRVFCGFDTKKPVVLIMGGSQGARAINNALAQILDQMLILFQVCHISGRKPVEADVPKRQGYREFEYISEEMGDIYMMADVVAGRAGATSVMELISLRKPNVLIPISSGSSRGDQIKNAGLMQKKGFSIIIDEAILNGRSLLDKIKQAYDDRDKLKAAMENEVYPQADEKIIDIIQKHTKRK